MRRNIRKSNEKPLRLAIEEFLEVYNLKNKINESKIMASWEIVVGEMVAKNTKRLTIRGKVLYVKVESAALRNELIYARTKIINALNKEVGTTVIEEMIMN
ncbi:MAG: DUF721 domain-containing protein [Bacteroidales bacterium]|jgi:predicted nucleic acid-binding Zn ribbon protein|nr:DUF721 domain-containing protein [Bacteroidales bacterium]